MSTGSATSGSDETATVWAQRFLNLTPGVEQLDPGRATGDEMEVSASEALMAASIFLQFLIGLALLLLFYVIKPLIPSVYAPVRKFSERTTTGTGQSAAAVHDTDDPPPTTRRCLCRYNLPWRDEESEREVLEKGGLDALLLLRMFRLCFEASLIATIAGGALQAARTATIMVTQPAARHSHETSMAHHDGFPVEYNFMVVPCIFVWGLSFAIYALVYWHIRGHALPCSADGAQSRHKWICCRPFRSFVTLRRERLSEPRAANFVVLAQDLPTELGTLREARNVFGSLFGSDVEAVIPVPSSGEIATNRLEALTWQRFRAVARLERAIGAVRLDFPDKSKSRSGGLSQSGSTASLAAAPHPARGRSSSARGLALDVGVVGSDSDSDVDPAAVMAALPPPASSLRSVEREFLGDPLVLRLRSTVARLDTKISEAMVRTEARLGYHDGISLRAGAVHPSAISYGSVDDERERSLHFTRQRTGSSPTRSSPSPHQQQWFPASGEKRESASLVSFRSLAGSDGYYHGRHASDEDLTALVGNEKQSKRGRGRGRTVSSLETFGLDVNEYGNALRLYENKLASAFVGFRTRAAAAQAVLATGSCFSSEQRWIHFRTVPDAQELRFGRWSDLARRRCSRNTRFVCSQFMSIAVTLMWAAPLSIVSATVMRTDAFSKALAYLQSAELGGPFSKVDVMLNDFLATLSLRLFLFVAPIVIRWIVSWQGEAFPSEQEASVLRKWFAFEGTITLSLVCLQL